MSRARVLLAVALICAIWGTTHAQRCTASGQGDNCPLANPWCIQVAGFTSFCSACTSGLQFGGGSCECDPSTSYCSSSTAHIGSCRLFTIVGKACNSDGDCITKTDNSYFGSRTEEFMYCVNKTCRPCSPEKWAQNNVGGASGIVTCAGFDSAMSDRLGRYATATTRPGTQYRCSSDGMIVMVNNTVDYNYQYNGPAGDRANWSPTTGSTSASSTLSATLSATAGVSSTTGAPVQVHSATDTTSTTGAGSVALNSSSAFRQETAAIVLAILIAWIVL